MVIDVVSNYLLRKLTDQNAVVFISAEKNFRRGVSVGKFYNVLMKN